MAFLLKANTENFQLCFFFRPNLRLTTFPIGKWNEKIWVGTKANVFYDVIAAQTKTCLLRKWSKHLKIFRTKLRRFF